MHRGGGNVVARHPAKPVRKGKGMRVVKEEDHSSGGSNVLCRTHRTQHTKRIAIDMDDDRGGDDVDNTDAGVNDIVCRGDGIWNIVDIHI
ncbi:hypothetical protein M8J75_013322 [Diaphorina citri]|nr:hypothetical protein M8J75_013322 [Diaphorina citri]